MTDKIVDCDVKHQHGEQTVNLATAPYHIKYCLHTHKVKKAQEDTQITNCVRLVGAFNCSGTNLVSDRLIFDDFYPSTFYHNFNKNTLMGNPFRRTV